MFIILIVVSLYSDNKSGYPARADPVILKILLGMQKTLTVKARLLQIHKKGYSYCGNPHYHVTLETEDGVRIYGKTAVNGSIGYGLTNYAGYSAPLATWEYHQTRTGSIIFDYVKK